MSAIYPEDHAEPSRTDDPRGEYTEQPKREPVSLLMVQKMLKRIEELVIASEGLVDEEYGLAKEALEFLKAEITEGRLKAVKTGTAELVMQLPSGKAIYKHKECDRMGYHPFTLPTNFCPGCGAKIKP